MMTEFSSMAIQAVLSGKLAFCKFLSSNDAGETGGHQSGIYVSKPAVDILFDVAGVRGENKERWVCIKWQGDFETKSRFIYYGCGTRDEYRITNFGRGFPFLRPEYTGALFVLIKNCKDYYQGFILNTEDDINQFLDAFGISPVETNRLININGVAPEFMENKAINEFIAGLRVDFPSSWEMSEAARKIENLVYDHVEYVTDNPDKKLVAWTDMEYRLFRALEHARYAEMIAKKFESVDDFVAAANQVLNRRKSRAGKSLEHHLGAIFDANGLKYVSQAVTEGNKKPDFLFPSQEAYHDIDFPCKKLITLGAKTTCKDRWRQIINEADRLKGRPKYLCTLQQGISGAQMDEMEAERVVLVVPKTYISTYPANRRDKIWTLDKFVKYVKETEGV